MRIREEPGRVMLERRLGWVALTLCLLMLSQGIGLVWIAHAFLAEHWVASLPVLGLLVVGPLLLLLATPFRFREGVIVFELTRTPDGVQFRRWEGPRLGTSRVVEMELLAPELATTRSRAVTLGGYRVPWVTEGTLEEQALRRLVAGPTWGGDPRPHGSSLPSAHDPA
ncbi:MAG: hypothetical protein H6722_20700 [Sandaracinus sp.]|nr:hypothetical protein [Sandaracinus sp.]